MLRQMRSAAVRRELIWRACEGRLRGKRPTREMGHGMNRKWAMAVLALALATGAGREGWAWGATGHEWISGIAIETLPDSLPGFVRTTEAAAEIAVMGRELDRSKGSGRTHDAERDPGHWVDLSEDGAVMGVLAMDALPVTREDY